MFAVRALPVPEAGGQWVLEQNNLLERPLAAPVLPQHFPNVSNPENQELNISLEMAAYCKIARGFS